MKNGHLMEITSHAQRPHCVTVLNTTAAMSTTDPVVWNSKYCLQISGSTAHESLFHLVHVAI